MMNNPYIFIKKENDTYIKKNPEYWNNLDIKRYKLLLKKSGIPKNYWDIEFDDYEGKLSIESKNKCIQYVEQVDCENFHNVNLFLVGDFGTQKTMCACAIGKGFIKQNYKVKFVYASEFIDLIMKTQGFSYIEEVEQKINKIINCDLLIIDDIFDKTKGTYWKNSSELVISAWDKYLRRLISEDIRIILTSNFSISVIKREFGDAIFNLIDRNFYELKFYDSIHNTRKSRFDNIFKENSCE